MIPIDLSHKTIFMTGALGAIAEHVVRRLTEAGALLVLTDCISPVEAEKQLHVWKIPHQRYVYLQVDVTVEAAVEQAVKLAFARFPSLDTVLGHAGGCTLHPFAATNAETFNRIFEFNFTSQTYLARAVLRHWTAAKVQGHLIFTSSYVARAPHIKIPAYASAKSALETFAKCLALEYGPQQIRVNLLSPGNVATGSSLKVYEEDADYREFVHRVSPLGIRNSPQAVADAMLFLCSPLARELNGHVLSVDMGVGIPKIG